MLSKLQDSIDNFRTGWLVQASSCRAAMMDLPDTLYPFWKRSAGFEYQGIPQDAFFFTRAAEGLLLFFECVRYSGKPCALPSKAADSVWHAWMRMAPQGLDAFCLKHFGRRIPHVEATDMTAQMEEALADCLAQARWLERKPEAGTSLPRLFALDRKLKMPGGFGYKIVAGEVAFAHMDERGAPCSDVFYPSSLAPVQLLVAGLISQSAYDVYVQRAKRGNKGGG